VPFPSDPTITTNDNVWGIPWVIGTKDWIPAFNEYSYASEISVSRQIVFNRHPRGNGLYATNLPPFTNQFYLMFISNAFGAEVWNFNRTTFTNSVTLIFSNLITVAITNDYNFGMVTNFESRTNMQIDSWPGWQ